MSDPSDAAVEAAAEAMAASDWSDDGTKEARAALTAAYPLIRAEFAAEIEAQLLVRVPHLSVGRVDGLQEAARIVRGGEA